MSKKSRSIRLQPIREQENNRKTFEGASVEPTITGFSVYSFGTFRFQQATAEFWNQ